MPLRRRERIRHRAVVRPHRAVPNPLPQERNFLFRQPLALRRHHFVRVRARHGLEQRTPVRLSRDDDGAVLPALHRVRAPVETELRFLLLLAVTRHAPLREQRPDVALKVHDGVGGITYGQRHQQQHDWDAAI
jgi:hypothetical protein